MSSHRSGARKIESVFLNVPYDDRFEALFVAYIVGITQLGLKINATLAVPNQGRLDAIIGLIRKSRFSIHDLSRIELSDGLPRFNMPVELGLALYRSRATKGPHTVFIFEQERHRAQRTTSDVNGIDPQIHFGTPKGIMAGLRNIFYRTDNVITVPEMLAGYDAVMERLPVLKQNAGGKSIFQAAVFNDIVIAASVKV